MNTAKTITTLKALANARRLRVMSVLAESPDGLNVKSITARTPIKQALISQHLSVLRQAGLVTARRNKSERIYTIASPLAHQLIKLLQEA